LPPRKVIVADIICRVRDIAAKDRCGMLLTKPIFKYAKQVEMMMCLDAIAMIHRP